MQLRKTSSVRRSNCMFNSTSNNQKQRRFRGGLFFTLLAVVFTAVVWSTLFTVRVTTTKSQTKKMEDQQQKKKSAIIRYKPVQTNVDDDNNMNVRRYAAYYVDDDDGIVSVADWIRLMTGPDSSELARMLAKIMRSSEFKAYRFETGPLSSENVSDTPFEFVLVEDTYLANFASIQDPNAFAEYLSPSSCNININNNNDDNKQQQQQQHPPAGCVFKNLGGDAILVAPNDWSSFKSEPSSTSYCAHLANFIRGASEEQIVQMWRLVAETLKERLLLKTSNTGPIWFSTAGTGVAWLHFRLDDRPKYYLYRPFKMFPPNKK